MPLDKDTIEFLVAETIEAALEDTKEKLTELAIKYKFKITVKPPILVEVEQAVKGEIIWKKD
ncbi:MAG: hypothetical protein JXA54_13170 [Candidatus Heimdallarchaeota archaeon]|nr:hypothetical protein [Candidatus Heimdallarchaeota archaeon]